MSRDPQGKHLPGRAGVVVVLRGVPRAGGGAGPRVHLSEVGGLMDSDVAMGVVVVLSVLSGAVITRLLKKL